MVYQFGGIYLLMFVGCNFFMGVELIIGFGLFKIFDCKIVNCIVVEEVQKMGIICIIDGDCFVGGLLGGECQLLVIVCVVYFGVWVLIFDELMVVFGVKQVVYVFCIVNEVKKCGLVVIFIIYQVMYVMVVGDYFVVLICGVIVVDFCKGEKI